VLHHREQHVQIPQPQAPADLIFPIDAPGHKQKYIGIDEMMEFPLY
jgi:hypothetical protein